MFTTRAGGTAGASATPLVPRRAREALRRSGRRLRERPSDVLGTCCASKRRGGRASLGVVVFRSGEGVASHRRDDAPRETTGCHVDLADVSARRAFSSARGLAVIAAGAASAAAGGSDYDGASEKEAAAAVIDASSSATGKTFRVVSYIFGWYFLNAVFAIINKRTLSVFPYPWILSWIQIAVGAAFMCIVWKLRFFSPPDVEWNWKTFKALAPTSALHLVAHVSACASYSLGSVSFMQVVKAGEPACSVVLLTLFFGRRYSKLVWLTLIPIVGGVAVGSTTELNFSMASFLCAMLSNVASALRAVTSKDMQNATDLRGINLYGAMSVVGATLLLPVSLLAEGSQLPAAFAAAPVGMAAKGIKLFGMTVPFLVYLLTGSMLFHLYNQTSYQALGELQPLDISVANAVKRVVIILASVAVFKNPITPLGAWAAAVAIFGTFLYSIAAQKQSSEKDTAARDT